MVDTLPTFDEDYGSEGDGSGAEGGSPEGSEDGAGGTGDSGQVAQSSGARVMLRVSKVRGPAPVAAWNQTWVPAAPMTAAEQVAILDRQLEESTRDFDGIIYDEEQRQREAARDRSAQTAANGRRSRRG